MPKLHTMGHAVRGLPGNASRAGTQVAGTLADSTHSGAVSLDTSPQPDLCKRYGLHMTRAFSNYRRAGHRLVDGWLHPEILDILKVLDEAQRRDDVHGSVAEIGVHHGKLFIGLHLLRQDDESSLAIDLFEDQDLNIDQSGRGNFRKFETNLGRWTDNTRVVTHQGDSTDLSGDQVKALVGSPIRLFSVDGGHTEEIVRKVIAPIGCLMLGEGLLRVVLRQ